MTGEIVPIDRRPRLEIQSIEEASRLSQTIAGTDFVPRALRGKPEAVLAAMLTGNELGVGPMQALSKIHVVEGRPAASGELMRALVLSKGHDIWIEESSNTRVRLGGQRAGSPRQSFVTWTIDDARAAGLVGKDNWRKYPRAMLLARATGELCRTMFADVLAGVSYTPEELEDLEFDDFDRVPETPLDEVEAQTPAAPAKTTRTAKKASATTSGRRSSKSEPKQRPPAPTIGARGAAKSAEEKPKRELTIAQKIALRCEEHDINRADVADAVSSGRTRKCSELEDDEALEAYQLAQDIADGKAKIVEGDNGPEISFDVEAIPNEETVTAEDIAEAFRATVDDDEITDAELVDDESSPAGVASWSASDWRGFLKSRGVKMTVLLREASRLCRDQDTPAPGTLDALTELDVGLLETLQGFVEDQGLEK